MTDSLGMSQSSPHTALRPVTVQYLVPGWTLRLQKSKGNSAQSKRKKSPISKSSLITAASTHDQSLYPNMDLSHVSLTSTVVFIVFFNQSLPFSEVVNKVVPHLTTTTKKKKKEQVSVQAVRGRSSPGDCSHGAAGYRASLPPANCEGKGQSQGCWLGCCSWIINSESQPLDRPRLSLSERSTLCDCLGKLAPNKASLSLKSSWFNFYVAVLNSHLFPDRLAAWSSLLWLENWTSPLQVFLSPLPTASWPRRSAASRSSPAGRRVPDRRSCPALAPHGCTRTPDTAAAAPGACRCTRRRWAGWCRRRSTQCPAGRSSWAADPCSALWPRRIWAARQGRGPSWASSRSRYPPASEKWPPLLAPGPEKRSFPSPGSALWTEGRRGTRTPSGRGGICAAARRASSSGSAWGGRCWGTWCVSGWAWNF